MNKTLKESFEWINLEGEVPKDRLLKVVAKTTAPTVHPEDSKYPVRLFAETELLKNSRSLIGRPVGVNHGKYPIYGAYAVDSEWNEEEKQLEALLYVPEEYVNKAKEGKIKNCSIEYTWRSENKTPKGTEFVGLSINRIDLVEGLPPGDSNAIVSLFETKEKKGRILAEVTLNNKVLGEPFAGYTNMDDCIAKNQDKEDPAAYCATIMRAVEQAGEPEKKPEDYTDEQSCKDAGFYFYDGACHAEPKLEEQGEEPKDKVPVEEVKDVVEEKVEDAIGKVAPETSEEEKVAVAEQVSEEVEEELKDSISKDERIKELEETVKRLQNNIKGSDVKKIEAVEQARKETKEELINKVSEVIPKNVIVRQGNFGLIRLTQDLKRVLRECKGNGN